MDGDYDPTARPADLTGAPVRGRVLVVDDDPTSRLKMAAAVRALGYDATEAEGGRAGLSAMAAGGVDLVLLDLMMPEIDGFEVLRRRAADPGLAHLPVLVVSGVDDVMGIAEAIELGAEDVLPKNFDPVLLRARVTAAVERSALRRAEAADIDRVHRLAAAAQIIEETKFDPNRLGLGAMARDGDDLGGLARVFLGMADRVHRRETALRARVGLFVGMLLLIGVAAVQGLQPVLARVLAGSPVPLLGGAAFTFLAGTVAMTAAAAFAGRWSWPSRGRLAAVLGYGLVSLALPRLLMLHVAEAMPAQTISLLIASQALMVFLLTVSMGIEGRSARRLLGLLVGFGGIGFVVFALGGGPGGGTDPTTLMLALLIPLGYAGGVVLLALRPARKGDNQLLHAAIAVGASGLLLSAAALLAGDVPSAQMLLGRDGLTLVGLGATSAVATVLTLVLVRVTGPVFSSQSGYAMTAGGVLWSVLLLGEPFGWQTAMALATLSVGMVLVMPRRDEPDLDTVLAGNTRLQAARARLGA